LLASGCAAAVFTALPTQWTGPDTFRLTYIAIRPGVLLAQVETLRPGTTPCSSPEQGRSMRALADGPVRRYSPGARQDLGLADSPALADLARRLAAEEQGRAGIDRGWIAAFVITLFGIHLGRMGLDRSMLGILSPLVAVVGDLALALLIAFGVVIPARLLGRRTTRGFERRAWSWCLDARGPRWIRTVIQTWLEHRLRFAVRLRDARYSLLAAVSRGLQIGLPAAAFVAATTPVFGMSWFFDTENWAAKLWSRWAEARTDTWREAMVATVYAREPRDGASAFAVSPASRTDRTSRSSSSGTRARATLPSTSCGTRSSRSLGGRTCASSWCRRM
jgi:hypothetical protein